MKHIILLIAFAFALNTLIPGTVITANGAETANGKIKDVDTQEQSLVVGLKDQDKVIYLDSKTQIIKGGQSASFGDLKVGMLVSLSITVKDGDSFAQKVTITP